MRRIIKLIAITLAIATTFNVQAKGNKIAIAAHRGFWNCEDAGFAQNSIASLREAQRNGFWGSEIDVHLTKDDHIVVNHDQAINGVDIHSNPFSVVREQKLANGETIPTLDEYLIQTEKSKTTKLVLEIKMQGSKERDEQLTQMSIDALKAHGLYNPERVMFISFSIYACEYIAKNAPEFTNQYLSGNLSPKELKDKGINGLDYHYLVLFIHPKWVKQAHELGMSVNVWTVNKRRFIKKCIKLGVDCITTNDPLLTRELLGEREQKLK